MDQASNRAADVQAWPLNRATASLLRLAADELDEAAPLRPGARMRAGIFWGSANVHGGTPEASYRVALQAAGMPADLVEEHVADVRAEPMPRGFDLSVDAPAVLP